MARLARGRQWLSLALAAALAGASAGCASPLFPDDEDRTPFDRYDAVRDRGEPAALSDEYGRRTPNLRGRLSRR